MELDFSLFEPLNGATPLRLLAAHPTEPLVALQIISRWEIGNLLSNRIRSAIWNRETHELVTVPENVTALVWSADGNEMGVIREQYNRDGDGRIEYDKDGNIIARFGYVWERFSWPEQELLDSCEMIFPTGSPENLVFSPEGDLIVVQWFDADKSGLEFIEQTRRGDMHLDLPPWDNTPEQLVEDDDGRLAVGANLATTPIFSPDGQFLVLGWQQREHWWSDVPDDEYVEGELPVRVGECQVGNIQVVDLQMQETRTLPIWVNLPCGWQPSYEGEGANELLNAPEFIDNERFQVKLPTGEMAVYSVVEA